MNWRAAARLQSSTHAPGEGTRPTDPWLGLNERVLSPLVTAKGEGQTVGATTALRLEHPLLTYPGLSSCLGPLLGFRPQRRWRWESLRMGTGNWELRRELATDMASGNCGELAAVNWEAPTTPGPCPIPSKQARQRERLSAAFAFSCSFRRRGFSPGFSFGSGVAVAWKATAQGGLEMLRGKANGGEGGIRTHGSV